uniref:Uncharacterized protein n=1 Tax=Physcomitrium patens TaxID=3218 RepID=A0A2K1K1X8_PHYPA|nr:hypothetical protein PHYPA_012254 [Physcomitrium patens]
MVKSNIILYFCVNCKYKKNQRKLLEQFNQIHRSSTFSKPFLNLHCRVSNFQSKCGTPKSFLIVHLSFTDSSFLIF